MVEQQLGFHINNFARTSLLLTFYSIVSNGLKIKGIGETVSRLDHHGFKYVLEQDGLCPTCPLDSICTTENTGGIGNTTTFVIGPNIRKSEVKKRANCTKLYQEI